jgi:hypothetical protein
MKASGILLFLNFLFFVTASQGENKKSTTLKKSVQQ